MYYYRKIKTMMLLLLVCVVAKAQLEDGKVYYFENVANEGKSMTSRAPGNYLTIATTNSGDYSQLWYADEVGTDVYTLRNLGNGRYLRSPNANGNANWTCVKEVEANAKFTCSKIDGHDVLRASNSTDSYHYLHYGGGTSTIVCWTASDAKASQWTFTEVAVDGETLSDNWATLASIDPDAEELATLQNTLDALFTDKSCTVLQSTYETMTEVAIMESEHYKSLPKTLQDMVLKVYNGNWAEGNYDNDKEDWDAAYAKKYRVQLYEPYNEPGAAASALGLNAHTNMNNPTGIFANTREPLYVMVEGKIKDGADLYITSLTGHNRLGNYNDGIALHEGLNVIPSFVDGNNYYINYVVHTFDTSKGSGHEAKARKLSDYDDLKIHIEGGYINGYWNRVGDALYGEGDTNSDWEYIEARATQTDVIVLGKYMTLQFPLRDEDTEGNMGMASYLNDKVDVEDVINSWDNVMLWERLLLGVLDEATVKAEAKQSPYSITDSKQVFEYTGNETDFPAGYGDYYNVHGLAFGVGGTAYMYGSSDHSGYHYNTMSGIIRNMPTNAGSHWGPAHEIGHQHQNLINMRGETEVSNNLFSNVVLWYYGETTSRVNGTDGALENVLKNFNAEGNYLTNSIWGMTHMYYKLFLYYHVLGHNPKFYPRLFEMLRQDPIDGRGGSVDGAKAQLHLYKKACLAAEEDLTEFFRAYGFFKPLDAFLMGDYGESIFYMTQAQIDAAIAEVKALSEQNEWDRNISVLFINDATGETIKSHKGDNLELYGETRVCAEVGSYATFTEDAASADYTCEISGNTITMSGTGGVGFAIFNEKGELIGFSDKKTFEISSECALAIMGGTAEIKAMNSDNTVEEIEYDEASVKAALLGGLLEEVSALLLMSDSVNKKPGFYKTSALEALQTAHDNATEVYGSKVSASYSTAYEALYREYVAALALTTGKVPFLSGSTYVLTNKKYPALSMAVNADNKLIGTTTNLTAAAQQWTFEPTGTADTYYLKNAGSSNYLGSLAKSTQAVATAATTAEASSYKLFDLGDGLWALQCQSDGDEQFSLHIDEGHKTVGWYHTANGNDGSWWYLTATTLDETDLPRYELEDLVVKTEALMSEVGRVVVSDSLKVTLTADSYYCNARCITTQWDQFTSYDVLCDGDKDTYLHTDYSGNDSEDGLPHYIRMDVGDGNAVQMFKITYTTRNYQYPLAPTSITMEGSNDLNTWHTIVDAFTEGLPETKATTFTSPTWGNGVRYRYVRFMVNNTITGQEAGPAGNKHKYFALSELGLFTVSYAEQLKSAYASMPEGMLLEAFNENLNARGVLAAASTPDEYEAAYEALKAKYDALLEAHKAIDDAAIDAKKAELQTLIDNTTSLIASCGSVTYTEPGSIIPTLQTTASGNAYYVWTNAQSEAEGPISGLVDGKYGSSYINSQYYFHTDYNDSDVSDSDDGLDHHITIDLGEGNEISEFSFQYWNRSNAGANFISRMEVYGSVDGDDYSLLATLSDMSATAGATYISPSIKGDAKYAHLRFMVTQNSSNNERNGHPFFHMSEFVLTVSVSESYTVELGANSGSIAEELMIAAFAEKTSAQTTLDIATTEIQLQNAIDRLQADYQALSDAKAYYTLYNYYTDEVKLATGNIVGSDAVGHISAALAEAYNTAYNNAAALLGSDTATDEDYTNAYNALVAANEALVVNMPEEGKYYALRCAHNGYAADALAYASPSDNKMYWATGMTTADATAIWTFAPSATQGKFMVTNLHTGTDINGFGNHVPSPLVEDGADVSIEPLSADGQVAILCNGTMMHAQSDYKAVVHWDDVANSASAWRIVEVEDMSLVNFSLTIGEYLHAGLYLNYPVTIPAGVKAYVIDGSDIEIDADGVGTLKLTRLEGTVLPAGCGYILDAPQGDYTFYYTADAPTDDVSGNMLGGSAYLTYREAEANHNYYVFGQKSGVVGLYKNAVKYNATGAEGTTHYKVSANKVLFDWDNSSSQVSSFRFAKEDATTEISDVVTRRQQVVHDLYGRRIAKIIDSGLYIVNGTKMYIKVK